MRSTRRVRPLRLAAAALLAATALGGTGCAALIEGAFRELDDHGGHARYENKDYLGHVIDAALESDDDRPEPRVDPCTGEWQRPRPAGYATHEPGWP